MTANHDDTTGHDTARIHAYRAPWADLMHQLRSIPDGEYWYVASPYSKYPHGIEAAFRGAARVLAALEAEGVPCYSPICHTHPIAVHGGIDPYDGARWLKFDAPLMRRAYGLLIAEMTGWQDSAGIRQEQIIFRASGRPVAYLPESFVDSAMQLAAVRKAA